MTAVLRSSGQSARQQWHRGIVGLLQVAPSRCSSNQQLAGLWRQDGEDLAVASIIMPSTALSNRSPASSQVDATRASQNDVSCQALQGLVSTTFAHSPLSRCSQLPASTASTTTTVTTPAVHLNASRHCLSACHGMATSSPSPAAVGSVDAAPGVNASHVQHPPVGDVNINCDSLFRSKAHPLGVGPNPSVVLPRAAGLTGAALSLLGFYSKESEQIRAARAMYKEVQARAEDPGFLRGQCHLWCSTCVP